MQSLKAAVIRAVPPGLRYLLVAAAIIGASWAYLTPAFQAPDENSHFAYVQQLAETGHRPTTGSGQYRSTEQLQASQLVNSDQTAAIPATQPSAAQTLYDEWRSRSFSHAQRADGTGSNPAAGNPPGYYALAVIPYKFGSLLGFDIFGRLMLVRSMGVLFVCALAVVAWHLAATLMPRSPFAWPAAAAVGSLVPMVDFITTSVSPDGLMYVLWALVLLAGVRILRGDVRWAWVLAPASAVAIAVKYPSAALLPGVAFVYAVFFLRHSPWPRARRARAITLGGGLAGLVALAVLVAASGVLATQLRDAFKLPAGRGGFSAVREYVSSVWQFYLPRLPFMTDFPNPVGGLRVWRIWGKEGIGAFGWLEVRLAAGVYYAVGIATGAAAAGGLSVVVARVRGHLLSAVFLALVAVALVVGLHWTDYKQTISGQPFIQGRYIFPLVPLLALSIGACVGPRLARWPRAQPIALGAVIAAIVGFQLLALGTVLHRFYG